MDQSSVFTMDRVTAIVLAGGRGANYGPLTELRTKAACPLAGYYRIIDFVLSNLSHSGIRQVGIIIQFLPASLMEHIGSGLPWDFDMADRQLRFMTPFVGMRETRWFRGSGDAIAKNVNLLDLENCETVMVLSGDHVYRSDYRRMMQHHRQTGADVTMAYVKIPPERQNPRFGNIICDDEGHVKAFEEKPAKPVSENVSIGVFCFKRDVLLDLLDATTAGVADDEFSLPADIIQPNIPKLEARAWHFDDYWYYLGNLQEYYDFHMKLARSEINPLDDSWNIMTNFSDRRLGSRPPAFFSPGSHTHRVFASPGCIIEGEVIDSVLSPGVHVGPGSIVRNSVIFHDVTIDSGCTIENAIIDKDVQIGAQARIGAAQTDEKTGRPLLTVLPKGQYIADGRQVLPEKPADILT